MKTTVLVLTLLFAVTGAAIAEVTLLPTKDSGMYAAVASGNSNRGLGGRFDLGGGSAGDGVLLQYDLTSVLGAGESIQSAVIKMYAARGTGLQPWTMNVVGYDLANAWVEGIGTTGGVVGSTGYPWGDCTVGDAVFNYASVSAVVADAGFGGYDVATAGTAWNAGGARDVGSDVGSNLLVSGTMTGGSISTDLYLGEADFSAAGVSLLNTWAAGGGSNNGLSLWTLDDSVGTALPVASIEHTGARGAELVLTIVPEPMTMALRAVGGLALFRRRRK